MRKPPLTLYFLFAWAAYAVLLTVAAIVWAQLAVKGDEELDLRSYLELFILMAARAIPGALLYALYFLAVKSAMKPLPETWRAVINWVVFFFAGSAGVVGFMIIAEGADLSSAVGWTDLGAILLSASLAMLLFSQLRRRLFAMSDEDETT